MKIHLILGGLKVSAIRGKFLLVSPAGGFLLSMVMSAFRADINRQYSGVYKKIIAASNFSRLSILGSLVPQLSRVWTAGFFLRLAS